MRDNILRYLSLALTLASVAMPTSPANADRDGIAPQCRGIAERLANQDIIIGAYQCGTARTSQQLRQHHIRLARCGQTDRNQLASRANQRSAKLETCIAIRLTTERSAAANTNTNENRMSGQQTASARNSLTKEREQPPADRIRDLLAAAPKIDNAAQGYKNKANAHDRTFRSGLVWSYGGPIEGMHCVQWREPSDPHDWHDNFLCTETNVGLQWSFRGPILGRGLNCIQVREKSDPHDWHDNYFCWPRDLAVEFRFSASGRISGYRCVAIVEPSDPHTWRDNYLCHRKPQS